uniref:Uncharacterized protein n=1 Tax=Timema bartmani TaxID=61472 RepID=A0A7R9ER65_9NEOP|nr:unnamed protein product [Timema bartmani]
MRNEDMKEELVVKELMEEIKNAEPPSIFKIFFQQSNVFLYSTSDFDKPDCIIIRRRTVSMGYDIRPETVVTT